MLIINDQDKLNADGLRRINAQWLWDYQAHGDIPAYFLVNDELHLIHYIAPNTFTGRFTVGIEDKLHEVGRYDPVIYIVSNMPDVNYRMSEHALTFDGEAAQQKEDFTEMVVRLIEPNDLHSKDS